MLALSSAYRRIDVEEFLAMDFGGAKAELEDGLIYMMAGGSGVHARVAINIILALGQRLRGSGCRPYGSDFATRTDWQTIRYPDVSIYCNDPGVAENDDRLLIGDPQVVIEVLSPSTATHDQKVKLPEYQSLVGVREIVLVDTAEERIRLVCRTQTGGWSDEWVPSGTDLMLPSLRLIVPHAEIFARN